MCYQKVKLDWLKTISNLFGFQRLRYEKQNNNQLNCDGIFTNYSGKKSATTKILPKIASIIVCFWIVTNSKVFKEWQDFEMSWDRILMICKGQRSTHTNTRNNNNNNKKEYRELFNIHRIASSAENLILHRDGSWKSSRNDRNEEKENTRKNIDQNAIHTDTHCII